MVCHQLTARSVTSEKKEHADMQHPISTAGNPEDDGRYFSELVYSHGHSIVIHCRLQNVTNCTKKKLIGQRFLSVIYPGIYPQLKIASMNHSLIMWKVFIFSDTYSAFAMQLAKVCIFLCIKRDWQKLPKFVHSGQVKRPLCPIELS